MSSVCTHTRKQKGEFDACTVCADCGLVLHRTDLAYTFHDINASHQPQKYKRITRFREVVRCFNGDSNANLPSYVVEYIRGECRKRQISNPSEEFVKSMVKRKPWSGRYLEQSRRLALLACSTGSSNYAATRIDGDLTKRLEVLFKKVEGAYNSVVSDLEREYGWKRKTFFNYGFLLGLLLDHLDKKALAEEVFSKFCIKTPELRKRQEFLWKQLCDRVGWDTDFETNCLLNGQISRPKTLHLKFGGGSYASAAPARSLISTSSCTTLKTLSPTSGHEGEDDVQKESQGAEPPTKKTKIIRKRRPQRRGSMGPKGSVPTE